MLFTYRLLYVVVFLTGALFSTAQESIKYEKEIPIDSNLVPHSARAFIANLKLENTKWVKEYSYDGTSFEVKAMWNKLPVSIEFDTTGLFEDVEITIKKSMVPVAAKKNIKTHLKQLFRKFKFVKIQLQFTGALPELMKRMNSNDESANVITKYEIELHGSIKTGWRFFEFLFDEQGNFILKREINALEIDQMVY